MRDSLPQSKKAVSELISYVLLIVIAIGASVLVYGALKLYVPKQSSTCQDGISLTISDSYICTVGPAPDSASLILSLMNRGKFTVDAAYIRIGKLNQRTTVWINAANLSQYYLYYNSTNGLPPGQETAMQTYKINADTIQGNNPPITANGTYILEIDPVVIDETTKKEAMCKNAIITQEIKCCTTPPCA
ncbi:MAG: hypothetical protein AABX85_02355 [Nanoarchaeota archaeon]